MSAVTRTFFEVTSWTWKKQKTIEVKTAADLQHLGGRFSSKPRQHGKHNVYFFNYYFFLQNILLYVE